MGLSADCQVDQLISNTEHVVASGPFSLHSDCLNDLQRHTQISRTLHNVSWHEPYGITDYSWMSADSTSRSQPKSIW